MKLKYVLLGTLLLGLIGAGFGVFYELNTHRLHEQKNEHYGRLLANHIWNLDDSTASEFVKIVGRESGTQSIQVHHADDRPFVDFTREEERPRALDWFFKSLNLIRDNHYTYPIMHEDREIGRIESVWENRNIYVYLYLLLVLLLILMIGLLTRFSAQAKEQKQQAEHALVENRKRLQSVVANAPVIAFSLNRDGVFTVCEGKGLDELTRTRGELVGRTLQGAFADVPEFSADFLRALQGETFSVNRSVEDQIFDVWYSPLKDDADVVGVMGVCTDITELKQTLDRLEERERVMNRELELAQSIHRALIPAKRPQLAGYEFGLVFVPWGGLGGDYFEFFENDKKDQLGVIFADICGHGVSAALLSSIFCVIVDDVLKKTDPPAALFFEMNKRTENIFPEGTFASTFYASFDNKTNTMTYVKASQEPAIIFRSGQPAEVIEKGGPALGLLPNEMLDDQSYQEHSLTLQKGDTVLLYTDGLIEVENTEGNMLDTKDLIDWVEEDLHLPPQELVEKLYERATTHAGTTDLPDDVAVLAIRVKA